MQPISPEALKLVHDKVPDLPEMVRTAHARVQGTVRTARLTLSLEDFEDDAFTLYAAVWYALSEGVDVLVRHASPKSAVGQRATDPIRPLNASLSMPD